jgi:hypothetical protein
MQPATSPRGRSRCPAVPSALTVMLMLLVTLVPTVVLGGPVAAASTRSSAVVTPYSPSSRSAVGSTDDPSPPTVTANEFIPEDRDLSECISALPKPDCGSDARGGWRQAVVLALVLAGTAGIGIRIALAIRRRDASMTAPVGTADDEHDGRVSQP